MLRQYPASFDNIRHFSTIFDIFWKFDNIRQYSTLFDNIWHYSTIFEIIWHNSTFFNRRKMSKNVAVYNFYCRIMSRTSKKVAVHSWGDLYVYLNLYWIRWHVPKYFSILENYGKAHEIRTSSLIEVYLTELSSIAGFSLTTLSLNDSNKKQVYLQRFDSESLEWSNNLTRINTVVSIGI